MTLDHKIARKSHVGVGPGLLTRNKGAGEPVAIYVSVDAVRGEYGDIIPRFDTLDPVVCMH